MILWAVNTPVIVGASAAQRQLPVYCVQRDDKKIAISFDAAWGNEDTQSLIDILSDHDVHSTFFVVGDWAEKYPESVKALHDAGHEVMSHSLHHSHFSMMSANDIAADLKEANRIIAAETGAEPTLFRCPYGEYDDHVIQTVKELGMTTIHGSSPAVLFCFTMQPSTRPRRSPVFWTLWKTRATPSFLYLSFFWMAARRSTTPESKSRIKVCKR